MKPSERFFTALLVPVDFFAIVLGGLLAYVMRFHPVVVAIRPVRFDLSFQDYVSVLLTTAVGALFVFAVAGLYHTRAARPRTEFGHLVLAMSTSMALVFAFLFFSRAFFESRFIALAAWGLAIFFVALGRLGVRGLQRMARIFGIGVHRILLIGDNKISDRLLEAMQTHPRQGSQIIERLSTSNASTRRRIETLSRQGAIDGVLLTDTTLAHTEMQNLFALCTALHLDLSYAASVFAGGTGKTIVFTVADIPIVEVVKTPLDGWGAIYKRLFDIVGALFLLVLTAPLMLVTAIGIVLESGRPIFFQNRRVGERGQEFNTLKFRSMKQQWSIGSQKALGNQTQALALERELIARNNRKQGPVYKIADDPRVTHLGRFLRAWSIDELPQLVNVLLGQMSLVGPRPHQPREVAKYAPHQHQVYLVKPGITGLSQVSGRSDLDFEDEIRLDTFYIERWSPWLDLAILLKTPFAVLFRKGAY